jgi:hypothetical protein
LELELSKSLSRQFSPNHRLIDREKDRVFIEGSFLLLETKGEHKPDNSPIPIRFVLSASAESRRSALAREHANKLNPNRRHN